MKRPDDTENTLDALRELPPEVGLDQVRDMVAAFPIAVGITAWLATLKLHLNTILMTTTGTLIVGTSAYLLSADAPALAPAQQARMEPAAVIELVKEPVPEEPAVVLEIPAPTPAPVPILPLPAKDTAMACTVRTEQTTVEISTTEEPAMEAVTVTIEEHAPEEEPATPCRPCGDRTFDAKDFNSIALRGSVNVHVEQGVFGVTAVGEGTLLDQLNIYVEDHELQIEVKDTKGKGSVRGDANVTVRMPRVKGLTVLGSGTLRVDRFDTADHLDLHVAGSGNLFVDAVEAVNDMDVMLEGSGNIRCNTAHVIGATKVVLTGSGDVDLGGRTGTIDVGITGSGDVTASGMKTNGARVRITGSGDAVVFNEGDLDVKITGSGTVHDAGSAGGPGQRGVENEGR